MDINTTYSNSISFNKAVEKKMIKALHNGEHLDVYDRDTKRFIATLDIADVLEKGFHIFLKNKRTDQVYPSSFKLFSF